MYSLQKENNKRIKNKGTKKENIGRELILT